jgi:hypothetical protein
MRLSHMEQRLEFLDLGEKLGWPRMMRLRAGKGNWEGMARADHRRFIPLLRAAKIRVENLQGEKESDLARTVVYGDVLRGLAEEVEVKKAAREAKEALEDPREDPRPNDLDEYIYVPNWPELPPIREEMVKPPRYTPAMRRANLAKAREARKAKRATA